MNAPSPRLRMFAGPNGSGKSTLKSETTKDEVVQFFKSSAFLALTGEAVAAGQIDFVDGSLFLTGNALNSYFASAAADFFAAETSRTTGDIHI